MMRNIILIGPMGAGKTSVGEALARRIGFHFIDADQALEAEQNQKIISIFNEHGELEFREKEAKLLVKLLALKKHIIAAGGGVVVREDNRTLLQEHGNIVFLDLSLATQLKRLAQDNTRLYIQAADRVEQLQQLAIQRRAWYESLANWHINTDKLSVSEIVEQVLKYLQ